MESIARGVLANQPLDRADALYLLGLEGADQYDVFYWAYRLRLHFLGERISTCSIAAVRTGGCTEDCHFCAQSSYYQTLVPCQRAEVRQIEQAIQEAVKHGAGCFGIVASGYGPSDEEIESLRPLIQAVTAAGNIRLSASLGCLSLAQARRLAAMGLPCYHHNLETSSNYFANVVTTHTFQDRVRTIKYVQQAGMKICCGGILGLGETHEDRVDLALALRDLDVDHVPLNFLYPIPGTPLAGRPMLSPQEALRAIAMFRFVLPAKPLHMAGGRGCLRDLQSWIFFAGADGCMVGNYLTTCGRPLEQDLQMIRDWDGRL